MAEIYLHVGLPKTGTTTIQNSMRRHKRSLAHEGLLYPETGLYHNGHHLLMNIFGKHAPAPWIPKADAKELSLSLRNEIDSSSGCVLLSSEAFTMANLDEIKGLFPCDKIRIVIFVRRQHAMIDSWVRQKLRAPEFRLSIKDAIDLFVARHDYEKIVQRWASHFGENQVLVYPVESAWSTGEGLGAFLARQLGVKMDSQPEDLEPSNTKLSREVLEYARSIHLEKMGQAERKRIWRILSRLSKEEPEPIRYRSIFSPSELEDIDALFRESNIRMAERFMSSEMASAFLSKEPSKDFDWEPWPGLQKTRIFEISEFILRLSERE